MNLPSVAIIIPTRDRIELLKRCLGRLLPYVANHPECSITVSDDGDASETRDALAGEMGIVQVIQGPQQGIPANRNYGAAHSTGEILIFLDDDCIPEPNLIATYRDAAVKNPDIGVFEGRISALGEASGFADIIPENETGGYLWSCNFAVRRSVFEKIDGFDDRLRFAAEDMDFHLRARRCATILFLPDARVWHEFARRVGWRIVQHRALCDILYLHLHGSKVTGRTPGFYIRHLARTMILGVWRHLRAGATKDPMQLILECVGQLQLILITLAWRFHPALARMFYPPCCAGCESIHANLAKHDSPLTRLDGNEIPPNSLW